MFGLSTVYLLVVTIATSVSAEINVIGTGSGRTGSTSLHEALQILGYKTYHMKEIITSSDRASDVDYWIDAYKTNCSNAEGLKQLFDSGGYTASAHAIHTPCVYRMIFDIYPDAKVIHTERTDAELWHNSVANSICMQNEKLGFKIMTKLVPRFRRLRNLIPHLFARAIVGSNQPLDMSHVTRQFCLDHKDEMIKHYKEHNARVKREVPKDRLLVLTNHKDGWGPICKFLGKDIPNVPFPHVNSRQNMFFEIMSTLVKQNPLILFGGIIALGFVVNYLVGKKNEVVDEKKKV